MKRALNFLSLSRTSALNATSDPSDQLPEQRSVIPEPSPADLSSPVWNDKGSTAPATPQSGWQSDETPIPAIAEPEWRSDEMLWVQKSLSPWTRWKLHNQKSSTLRWLFSFWRFLVLARRAAESAPEKSEERANPAEWLEESLRDRDFLKAQLETLLGDVSSATAAAAEARRKERRAKQEALDVAEENKSLKSQLQQVSASLDSSLGAFTKTLEGSMHSSMANLDEADWKKKLLEEYDRAVACGRSQAFSGSNISTPAHSNLVLDDVSQTPQGSLGRFLEPKFSWEEGPLIQKGKPHGSFSTPRPISARDTPGARSQAAPPSSVSKDRHCSQVVRESEQSLRLKEEEHISALEGMFLRLLETHDKLSNQLAGRREIHGWAAKEQALSERVFALQREVERRKEMANESTRQLTRAMDRLATAEARIEELEGVVQRAFKDSESRQGMHEQVTKQHAALRQLSEEVTRRQELVTQSGQSLQAELDSERQLTKMLENRLANADSSTAKVKQLQEALSSVEKKATDSAREARQLRASIAQKQVAKIDVGCDAWTPPKLELSRIWAVDDRNQLASDDAEGEIEVQMDASSGLRTLRPHGITLSRRGGVSRGEEGVPETAMSRRGAGRARAWDGVGSAEYADAAEAWKEEGKIQRSLKGLIDEGQTTKEFPQRDRRSYHVDSEVDQREDRNVRLPTQGPVHSPNTSALKVELGRLWNVLGDSSQ